MRASIQTRILGAIAAPVVVLVLALIPAAYMPVVHRRLADLDESLQERAAATAGYFADGEDGWVIDFEGGPGPAPDIARDLVGWRVQAMPSGEVLAEDEGMALPGTPGVAVADLSGAGLPWERPQELAHVVQTVREGGRELRLWSGLFAVRIERDEIEMLDYLPDEMDVVPYVQVTIAEETASLNAYSRMLLLRLLWIGAALCLVAVGVGWLLSRQIVGPLEQMLRRAEAVQAPSPEPPLPLSGAGDELDRFAETLNRAFMRLHAAYMQQARFTADASHELRTPLALIRAEADVALRRPEVAPEVRATLSSIVSGVEQLQHTLDGLLLLARADNDALVVEWEPVDIFLLAEELLASFEGDGGPALALEGAAGCVVKGDANQLEILLRNLLSNAVRHTPPQGSVTVRVAERPPGVVRIEVEDTGCGVAAHDLPRLFDRFFRVDDGRARRDGGVGLGLALVHAIVTAHQGSVTAESEIGRGSRFVVELNK